MTPDFKVHQGIAIQASDLAQWARRLNPETFQKVYELATKGNAEAKSGYDICRGDAITEIILNLP